jgi:C_GCAxxG_C_C family probable redox protein
MKEYDVLINKRVHHYYWDDDINCAKATLKILSEIFGVNLSSQVLDSAIGMHGAGRFGAQCGLLEGTIMFIGIIGRERGCENGDIVNYCYNFSNEFQNTFGSLVCKELRPQGFKPENPPHLCEELTKKAVGLSVNYISKIIT